MKRILTIVSLLVLSISMHAQNIAGSREYIEALTAHLVEHIVLTSEFTALTDEFGEDMIKKGIYTAGQIDSAWGEDMNEQFKKWLKNYEGNLPMSKEQLEAYIKERNF